MNNDIKLISEPYKIVRENLESEIEQNDEQQRINDAIAKLPEHTQEIARDLKEYLSKGARRATFYYRSKDTGREGIYEVNLGISYNIAKEETMKKVRDYLEHLKQTDPTNPDIQVAEDILNPQKKKSPPKVDRKISLGHGITIQDTVKEPNVYRLYIYGYVEKAPEEIVPAEKQRTYSAKEQLQYKLGTKLSKFRMFILDPENIAGLTAKGGMIEFHKDEV